MADVTLNIRHNADQATSSVKSLSNAMGSFASNSRKAASTGTSAADGFKKIGQACLSAGRSATKGASGLSKFTSSLGRIAFYRAIRSAIRYVTDSFKQGLDAAYNWSKQQGGANAKLAGAMDALSAAAGRMKLQLGAAFGGLLTAITPILIQIINLVTAAADAVTRFFAVLNGTGYYKKASEGFEEVGNSAGGAGKKIKGLLASWDELNVIGKESGGGGGGSSATDYSGAYVWEPAQSELATALLEGNLKKVGEIIGNQLREWGGKLDEWWDKYFGNDNKYWKTAIEGLADFFVGLLRGMGFEQAASNLELFVAKVKAALGLVTEYYEAFLEAMDNSKLSIPFLTIEKWITGIKADFNSLARDIAATIQESPALRRIFGDQSAYIFRMDAETAAAKEKIAEIDKKIDELQKNGDEGVDIEAHVNHEKVDEYKKTLTTPWFVSEIDARMRNKVEQADVFNNKTGVITNPTGGITLGLGILPRVTGTIELKSAFTNQGGVSQDANGLKATMNIGAAMASKVSAVQAFTDTGGVSQTKDGLSTTFKVKPEVEGAVDVNVGLKKDGWTYVSEWVKEYPGTIVSKEVSLLRSGWTYISEWVKEYPGTIVSKEVSLLKSGWTYISEWVKKYPGTIVSKEVSLLRSGWTYVSEWVKEYPGTPVSVPVGINATAGTKIKSTDLVDSQTVKINAELSNAEAFTKALKEALKVKVDLKAIVNDKTSTIGTIKSYTMAQGGIGGILDMPGQLFVAREAGPELVGTMGGHNAVANNQQIVEGIQSGVAQANQEQNVLLGQIVNGVYKLLQKDITISPSVALGQVMARSADMYARA